MESYIWLIPVIPLLGFLLISLFGKTLPKAVVSVIGVGSVTVSAIITIVTGINFLTDTPASGHYSSEIYSWVNAGGFNAGISFVLDPLSLIFCFVITFVGTMIHLYSVEFMKDDDGFSRFFAYMNLFVASMLILVLAGNMLLLYLGWEGVGLCSYLLIGFWYREPANIDAANKAFIVTRIGDTAMIMGIILLFVSLGTLDIDTLMQKASATWSGGSTMANIAAILLLAGALGKSAQLPLQVWLPDAMAGPSPVSALIHAATMVTAGVYLITRTHVLFTLAPAVMTAIAVIGSLTLLISGFSALVQNDLKRILAYSTISQIGYMFVAMGIGAWSAGIFHFMTHAFFKALLFLSGGAVIHLLFDEHDIFRMGGLRKKLPLVFYTFLAGAASLAALPLITAGFYSKDEIIFLEWSSEKSSLLLWIAGVTGSLLTSLYIFRLVFIVFFGDARIQPSHKTGLAMAIPMVVLAVVSITGGFVEMPENLGPVHLFSRLFGNSLPTVSPMSDNIAETIIQIITAILSIGGIYFAWRLYIRSSFSPGKSGTGKFLLNGWGFDTMYKTLFIRPVEWISAISKNDVINNANSYISESAAWLSDKFSLTQTGKIRWYVFCLTLGIVLILTFMISQ